MGITYRVFIIDEFDWKYVNFDRSKIVKDIKALIPYSSLEADIPHIMIFDIGKTYPSILQGKITCDKIYYLQDNELKLIELEKETRRMIERKYPNLSPPSN